MKSALAMLVVLAASVTAVMTAGCQQSNVEADLRKQNQTLSDDNRKLQDNIEGMRKTQADQQKQIESLQALGPGRLGKLFVVHSIELGRYTGGINTDGREGDDAVKVYLQPKDQDGTVIKAAGDVRIQLYDLADKPAENLIGEYVFPVDAIGKNWSDNFMSYHYSFVCPWKNGLPLHNEITVRVVFTDYLTGKEFSAQTVCKIAFPPPASAPASAPTTQPAK